MVLSLAWSIHLLPDGLGYSPEIAARSCAFLPEVNVSEVPLFFSVSCFVFSAFRAALIRTPRSENPEKPNGNRKNVTSRSIFPKTRSEIPFSEHPVRKCRQTVRKSKNRQFSSG